jgi:ribose 5-phosphate isomerase B
MKVYLASDHAGFNLKEKVKEFLLSKNYDVLDCGDFAPNKDDDYPVFVAIASEKVSQDVNSRAIVFGKSGAGEEIVANKFENVRAVLGFSEENVKLARLHNDANILSLGSQFVNEEDALNFAQVFLETEFSNEQRHKRRIEEIKKLE